MKKISLYALLAVFLVAATGCAEKTSFEDLRNAALGRPRLVVYNTDGCDMLYYPTNLPVSAEGFCSLRLDWLKGTTVGTVSYCPVSSGFGHFTALKAGDLFPGSVLSSPPSAGNATLRFRDSLGTDSLQMAIDFCRQEGREVFVGIRVNDTHDADPGYGRYFFPPFKKARPECLAGSLSDMPPFCSWTAVDFACRQVRDHMRRFVREFVENYDVDGIEYDFMRHPQLFRTVAWGGRATAGECALMTELMRDLREITEEVGRRRGRPILVVVRTPDSVAYSKAIGIDLEAWFSAKTADIWVGGGYFQHEPWSKAVAFARKHGVRFYASIDESRIARKAKDSCLPIIHGRGSKAFYDARFAAAMTAGCDGVYLFNLEFGDLNSFMKTDVRDTDGLDKLYFATERGSGGYRDSHFLKGGAKYRNMPQIDPGEPTRCKGGEIVEFSMILGEDFASSAAKGFRPSVKVQVLTTLVENTPPEVFVNGTKLAGSTFKDGLFTYAAQPELVRKGENRFSVAFPADTTFNDFLVKVDYVRP